MIIELTVTLITGAYAEEPWTGVIEIDELSSLEQLHYAIQDAVNFDNDHLFEFYIARIPFGGMRRSLNNVDFDDYGIETDDGLDLLLKDIFPVESGRKLFYLFDFGDSWVFSISKGRKKAKEPVAGVEYPHLCRTTGVAPQQYPDYDED